MNICQTKVIHYREKTIHLKPVHVLLPFWGHWLHYLAICLKCFFFSLFLDLSQKYIMFPSKSSSFKSDGVTVR